METAGTEIYIILGLKYHILIHGSLHCDSYVIIFG